MSWRGGEGPGRLRDPGGPRRGHRLAHAPVPPRQAEVEGPTPTPGGAERRLGGRRKLAVPLRPDSARGPVAPAIPARQSAGPATRTGGEVDEDGGGEGAAAAGDLTLVGQAVQEELALLEEEEGGETREEKERFRTASAEEGAVVEQVVQLTRPPAEAAAPEGAEAGPARAADPADRDYDPPAPEPEVERLIDSHNNEFVLTKPGGGVEKMEMLLDFALLVSAARHAAAPGGAED